MRIINLHRDDTDTARDVAALLVEFGHDKEWPDVEAALTCLEKFFARGTISRVAIDDDGAVLGWYGAIEENVMKLWERRLAVVAVYTPSGEDVWAALNADFEEQSKEHGGVTAQSIRQPTYHTEEHLTSDAAMKNIEHFIDCMRRATRNIDS